MNDPYRTPAKMPTVDEKLESLIDGMTGVPGTHRHLMKKSTTWQERVALRKMARDGRDLIGVGAMTASFLVSLPWYYTIDFYGSNTPSSWPSLPLVLCLVSGLFLLVSFVTWKRPTLERFRDVVSSLIQSRDGWVKEARRSCMRIAHQLINLDEHETSLIASMEPWEQTMTSLRSVGQRLDRVPMDPLPRVRADMYANYLKCPSDALGERTVAALEKAERFRAIAWRHLNEIPGTMTTLWSIQQAIKRLNTMMDEMEVSGGLVPANQRTSGGVRIQPGQEANGSVRSSVNTSNEEELAAPVHLSSGKVRAD